MRELYDHEQMLYEDLVKRGWVEWCDHYKDYCSATFGAHVIRGFEAMAAQIRQWRWRTLWAGWAGILLGILIGYSL